jgi:hypothetical protein
VEFFQRTDGPAKPFAGVAGVPIDAAVCVGDTAADVLLMYPLTLTHGGPDAQGCLYDPGVPEALGCALISIIWWPATLIALQVWPEDMYSDIFGSPTGLLVEHSQESVRPNNALQLTALRLPGIW